MENFVHDAAAKRLDGLFLIGRELAETPANPIKLRLTNGFELVLKRNNCGLQVKSLQPSLKALDFSFDNLFSAFGFVLSASHMRADGFLQIVNVIDEDAVEFVHFWINVAWHCDINE